MPADGGISDNYFCIRNDMIIIDLRFSLLWKGILWNKRIAVIYVERGFKRCLAVTILAVMLKLLEL